MRGGLRAQAVGGGGDVAKGPGIATAVAIDEAVELAKSLSTDNSPRFVNGVLGQLMAVAGKLRAGSV